jgi:hypothetical protein
MGSDLDQNWTYRSRAESSHTQVKPADLDALRAIDQAVLRLRLNSAEYGVCALEVRQYCTWSDAGTQLGRIFPTIQTASENDRMEHLEPACRAIGRNPCLTAKLGECFEQKKRGLISAKLQIFIYVLLFKLGVSNSKDERCDPKCNTHIPHDPFCLFLCCKLATWIFFKESKDNLLVGWGLVRCRTG